MLTDADHSFLFVHVQKTGGDTASRMLRQSLPDVRRTAPKHARIDRAPVEVLGAATYKFGFVRNPWDRLVSWYSMIEDATKVKRWQTWTSSRARSHHRQIRNSPFWLYVVREATDFHTFVDRCTDEIPIVDGYSVCAAWPQLSYLDSGTAKVDRMCRFEELATELAVVAERLGITDADIPHENPSSHGHYRSFYDARRRDVVAGRFAADIDAFGYEF